MYDVTVEFADNSRVETRTSYMAVVNTGTASYAGAWDPHSVAMTLGIRGEASAAANSMAIAMGDHSTAYGDVGAWLILTEQTDSGMRVVPVYIDGETYQAYSRYALHGGAVVNVDDIVRIQRKLQDHLVATYRIVAAHWDTLVVYGTKRSCTLRISGSHVYVQCNDKTVKISQEQLEAVYSLVDMLIGNTETEVD